LADTIWKFFFYIGIKLVFETKSQTLIRSL
jgi:hypothetical protein